MHTLELVIRKVDQGELCTYVLYFEPIYICTRNSDFVLSHKVLRTLSALRAGPINILVWYLDIASLAMNAALDDYQ